MGRTPQVERLAAKGSGPTCDASIKRAPIPPQMESVKSLAFSWPLVSSSVAFASGPCPSLVFLILLALFSRQTTLPPNLQISLYLKVFRQRINTDIRGAKPSFECRRQGLRAEWPAAGSESPHWTNAPQRTAVPATAVNDTKTPSEAVSPCSTLSPWSNGEKSWHTATSF